jgi:hypothetical protein
MCCFVKKIVGSISKLRFREILSSGVVSPNQGFSP